MWRRASITLRPYTRTSTSRESGAALPRNLKIYEAKLGPDHPDVARILNNLAILYV